VNLTLKRYFSFGCNIPPRPVEPSIGTPNFDNVAIFFTPNILFIYTLTSNFFKKLKIKGKFKGIAFTQSLKLS
jgi:hypothetical protein